MALRIEQMSDITTDTPLCGFFVVNAKGKRLAVGATGKFVVMMAKRYEHDLDLCRKVRWLTGISPRGLILDERDPAFKGKFRRREDRR